MSESPFRQRFPNLKEETMAILHGMKMYRLTRKLKYDVTRDQIAAAVREGRKELGAAKSRLTAIMSGAMAIKEIESSGNSEGMLHAVFMLEQGERLERSYRRCKPVRLPTEECQS